MGLPKFSKSQHDLKIHKHFVPDCISMKYIWLLEQANDHWFEASLSITIKYRKKMCLICLIWSKVIKKFKLFLEKFEIIVNKLKFEIWNLEKFEIVLKNKLKKICIKYIV